MADAVALAVAVAAWNNLLHLSPPRWRRWVVTTGVVGGAAAGAAWSLWLWGARASGLGGGAASALWWGAAAATACGGVVAAGWVWPRLGAVLVDGRIAEMSNRRFLREAVVRIPLVTGLAEEVLFRGVAWAALAAVGGHATAWVGTSLGFGAWHVVVSAQQARREAGRRGGAVSWTVTNVVATGLAGAALGGLRLLTGGIWAPAAVHTAVNLVMAVGARLHASSGHPPRRLPHPAGSTPSPARRATPD